MSVESRLDTIIDLSDQEIPCQTQMRMVHLARLMDECQDIEDFKLVVLTAFMQMDRTQNALQMNDLDAYNDTASIAQQVEQLICNQ
jgi:hypothetical protein